MSSERILRTGKYGDHNHFETQEGPLRVIVDDYHNGVVILLVERGEQQEIAELGRNATDFIRAAEELADAAKACAEQLDCVGDSRKDAPFVEAVREAVNRLEMAQKVPAQ